MQYVMFLFKEMLNACLGSLILKKYKIKLFQKYVSTLMYDMNENFNSTFYFSTFSTFFSHFMSQISLFIFK